MLRAYGSLSLTPAEPGDGWVALIHGYEGAELRFRVSSERVVSGIDLALPDAPGFSAGCIG